MKGRGTVVLRAICTVTACISLTCAGCSGEPTVPTTLGTASATATGTVKNPQETTLTTEQRKAVKNLIRAQERRQDVEHSEIPRAFVAAHKVNPDVYAWLYVPRTNVSLALTQRSGDDSYYYEHDATGEHSVIGSAYSTQENSCDFTDPVTVLYGHSFSDADIVFTQLHRYEKAAFSSTMTDSISIGLTKCSPIG